MGSLAFSYILYYAKTRIKKSKLSLKIVFFLHNVDVQSNHGITCVAIVYEWSQATTNESPEFSVI